MNPGDLVAGRFEIERVAGQGGMSTVYRARDRSDPSERTVALKVLHAGRADEERFVREAEILALLDHPAFVRYVDFGRADGRYYLATEWLEGYDLAERLRQGPLGLAGGLELAERLAGALAHLHELGIVHRDVKPSNVFLIGGDPGEARLVDLGIARRGGAFLTLTGELLGTPAYMAPEQARGESEIDGRADLFSLGCLLFECLAGRPAFQGANPVAVLAKILWEPAPRLAEVLEGAGLELDELIGSLLAKERSGRPRSAREIEQKLRRLRHEPSSARSGGGAGARPAGRTELAPRGLDQENELVSIVLLAPREILLDAAAISGAATAPDPANDSTSEAPPQARTDQLLAQAQSYGGEVQALANGAVVVTIRGAGVATDRASLAARCAIALHRTAGSLAAALATGRATLSARLPVGEVIDRAARLLRVAGIDPRFVRLDEVTAGLLDARFELGGDDEGFFLREELAFRSGLRPMLGTPSPFVGREGEMALLRRLAEEVLLDREARALLVLAPPGGGKSRLLSELVLFIESHEVDAELWLGRADPLAAAAPFGLLGSALRQAAAIRDDEPPALKRGKLRARLRRHLDEATAARVALFLGELIGAGPEEDAEEPALRAARRDPQLMGDQLRRAWLDLLAAESREQPLFLVLEDLHWGDLPSVATLDAALGQLGRQAFGVLAAGRPETAERFPQLWAARSVAAVPLRALGRRPAAALVRARLGDDAAAEVVERLVEHAGGNPFFLEELARARAEGRAEALPETVLAMVQVRFESLPAELRRILRAASLFGQSFWQRGVEQLLSGPGGDGAGLVPAEALARLEQLELIERRLPSRFAVDAEFGFRHALFREAAYALLTTADCRLGHRLAGQWLERVGELSPLVLAEHFDRGDQPHLAAPYFALAAERDLEGGDVTGAQQHALRGLLVADEAETRGRLHLIAAEACRWSGRLQETQRHAEMALADLAPHGRRYFRALGEGLVAASRRGDAAVAGRLFGQLLAARSEPEHRSAHLFCLALAARQVFHEGRSEEAEALVARAEDLARESGLEAWALAELDRLRGARARHRGDVAGDLAGYAAALASFETIGDRRSAANTRISLGFAFLEVGALERGEAELRQGLALAEELGIAAVRNRALQNLGLALVLRGEPAAAIPLLEQVVQASRQDDNKRFEGWTRIYLASARLAAGDAANAAEEAALARDLLAGSPPARAGALAVLARAEIRLGRTGEAKQAAAEAMAVLHEQGGIEEFESLVRLAWIEVLAAQNDTAALLLAAWSAHRRIESRAAAIADEELRRSFKERLPENAALLAHAASLPARAEA